MVIITLPELIPYVDNGLWFALEKPGFRGDVTGCFPAPYAAYFRVKPDVRSAQTSGGRHDAIMQLLRDMFKSNYNATVSGDRGQKRITIQGPSGTFFSFVLRRAHAAEGGFSSSRAGAALETASLLHVEPDAFELVPGHPNQKGIFLAHWDSKNLPNHIDVWLAYEWEATDGDSFIRCERCAFLGSVPFGKGVGKTEDPTPPVTGGDVDLE